MIVAGEESWGNKKLCKSPGSARYDVIEVSTVVYGAATTQAAFDKVADPKLRQLRAEIEAMRGQIQTGRAETDAARLALLTAQQRFIGELATRDRAYAQAMAQFRGSVADIAATSEGVAALGQYNAGDEAGALAILDRLRSANDTARKTQSDVASAAEGRRIAGVALDARAKGKLGTAAVIARFEEVTRLDPGVFQDWINLVGLYLDAGRLEDAMRSTSSALRVAASDRDRVMALDRRGDVQFAQGDPAVASKAYAEGLALARKLAKTYPEDAQVQRFVAVSLERLGSVRIAEEDLVGANAAFAESLAVRRRLAASDPGNAPVREVAVSLAKIGELREAQGDLAGAAQAYDEGLAIARKLALIDPVSAQTQRDISVSLSKLGDVESELGYLSAADSAYCEGLAISRKLADADGTSARARRDVATSLERLGTLRVQQGKADEAKSAFEEFLAIARTLAAADPADAQAQRDVAIALARLAQLPGAPIGWHDVVAHLEAMAAKGLQSPSDAEMLAQARANELNARR